MTVLEVIQRSTDFLGRKGVESPRLQVELLLAHVLQIPRLKLYLDFERPLTPEQLDRLRLQVQRRGQREPLQHILGSTSFLGFEIAVNRDVLIPRPETEQLAALAGRHLEARGGSSIPVLDFGTGSGCLAIAIAVQHPPALVHAVDISPAALAVARANAATHGVAGRIQFHQSDGMTGLPELPPFELIVSNPPYIASEEIASLEPEVRDFDPRLALDGGPDGLDFFRRLASESASHLTPGGSLMVEFGEGQGEAVQKIFTDFHWHAAGIERDLSGRDRFFVARRSD